MPTINLGTSPVVAGQGLVFSGASLNVNVANSIIITGDQLQLVGDQGAPGVSRYYGTNAAGIKGWYVSTEDSVGVAAINNISGSLSIVGTGTVSVTTIGQTIYVSGVSGGVGDATQSQLNAISGFFLTPPQIDLAGSSILRVNTNYYDDFGANRNLVFTGTPSGGSTIKLRANVTELTVLGVPTGYRIGDEGITTGISLAPGNHEISWVYADSKWWMADTAGGVDNLSATRAPLSIDDQRSGYVRGSQWLDTTVSGYYICLNANTSGASWYRVNGPTGLFETVTATSGPINTSSDGVRFLAGAPWAESTGWITGRGAYVAQSASLNPAIVLLSTTSSPSQPIFAGSAARGSLSSITPTQIYDGPIMLFRSYGGSTWANSARIEMFARETHTESSRPSYIALHTTASGSTSPSERMRVSPAGNVGVGISEPVVKFQTYGSGMFTTNPTALSAGPNSTVLHIGAQDGVTSRLVNDAFAAAPVFVTRRANGTAASKTAVTSGNFIGSFASFGYKATEYSAGGGGFLGFSASENWTDSAIGTDAQITVVPRGSTSQSSSFFFSSENNLGIGTNLYGTSASKVISMATATPPTSSPAGVGQLYVVSGALVYRGSGGTVTVIGPA